MEEKRLTTAGADSLAFIHQFQLFSQFLHLESAVWLWLCCHMMLEVGVLAAVCARRQSSKTLLVLSGSEGGIIFPGMDSP